MAKKIRTRSSKSVSAAKANPAQWTVMVFMGADTIEGNAPLGDAEAPELEQEALRRRQAPAVSSRYLRRFMARVLRHSAATSE